MLVELRIKDFAIIEELSVNFKSGLNILSGETGAGKSIILKSLFLLMGHKAPSDLIRHGKEQASIEGRFDLSQRPDLLKKLHEMDLSSDEDELVVRRLVTSQGSSKVYINGSLSNLQTLKSLVSPLVEINGDAVPLLEMTGQHENKNLTEPQYHLETLDLSSQLIAEVKEYQSAYHELLRQQNRLLELRAKSELRVQRIDYLEFQLIELTGLNLNKDTAEELEGNYKKAKNLRRISEYLEKTDEILSGSSQAVVESLSRMITESEKIAEVFPELNPKLAALREASSQLNDFSVEIVQLQQKLSADSLDVNEIEEQISRLRKLQKKFGPDIVAILETKLQIETELHELKNFESEVESIEKNIAQTELICKSKAQKLHDKRLKFSKTLAKDVNAELTELNMKGVEFAVQVTALEELNSFGMNRVEFVIRNSKADSFRPISKVASGGELSRILLSIKSVLGRDDRPRTFLFDEVDTGVSGQTAEKVGRKLRKISLGQQLICVTHLPQVAAFATSHFLIEKTQKKDSVSLKVVELKQKEREEELARLISGETITDTSRKHARQLLKQIL